MRAANAGKGLLEDGGEELAGYATGDEIKDGMVAVSGNDIGDFECRFVSVKIRS